MLMSLGCPKNTTQKPSLVTVEVSKVIKAKYCNKGKVQIDILTVSYGCPKPRFQNTINFAI